MTFCEGEDLQSGWIDDNAFVSWIGAPEPWITETGLLLQIACGICRSQV